MHPIEKQKNGLPLHPSNETQIDYVLKSKRGRPVMSFSEEKRAREEAQARNLDLYRVTTFTEKL